VRTLPDVRFVLDHAGKPAIADGALEPWRTDLAAFDAIAHGAKAAAGLVEKRCRG